MGKQQTGPNRITAGVPSGFDPLWNTDDVAAFLNIPARTVQGWRSCAKGPRYFRVGKHARYRASDVLAWLESDAAAEVP